MSWWNSYVGIPYAAKGRTRAQGLDCWGLVRLIHAEQLGYDLPSFDDCYDANDPASIAEAIALKRENWTPSDLRAPGDVVLFRIAGAEMHVGMIVTPGTFIHVREGQSTVIEALDGLQWRSRIVSVWRYAPHVMADEGVRVTSIPHPFKAIRVSDTLAQGLSLAEIDARQRALSGLPLTAKYRTAICVDGVPVPRENWAGFIPAPGQEVTHRAVPAGSGSFNSIIKLTTSLAGSALSAIPGVGWAIAGAAVALGGSLLADAVFPQRAPQARAVEEGKQAQMLNGGSNVVNRYGAVPAVFGMVRYTPPLAAQNIVESDGDTTYLRMMPLWGYGGLQISNIRIGDVPITTLDEVEIETIDGTLASPDLSRFNSIYGEDSGQEFPNLELVRPYKNAASASILGTTVTVVMTEPHGYQVGWDVSTTAPSDGNYTITAVPTSDSFQFTRPSGTLPGSVTAFSAAPFIEEIVPGFCDRINVALHFAQGLRLITDAGGVTFNPFRARVEVRQLDPNTLSPIGSWQSLRKTFQPQTVNIQWSFFNTDTDTALEPVYRWWRFTVDEQNKLRAREGAFTLNPAADPTGDILNRQVSAASATAGAASFKRLPDIPAGEVEIWRICTFGAAVHDTVDLRSSSGLSITGCGLTRTGVSCAIAAGTMVPPTEDEVTIGASGQPYALAKDAFTYNVAFVVPRGRWQVRVQRRTKSGPASWYTDPFTYLDSCRLLSVTGYDSTARPVVFSKPLARSALRIKATDQINGNVEGVSATLITVCPDYNVGTGTWITRPTRNPASLFRYLFQHPGNPRPVADSLIDLAALADWHDFCRTNAFMFDYVATEATPVIDMANMIARAGRASLTVANGKISVIVEKDRTTDAVQLFTPHNSWGFSGSIRYQRPLHGYRVPFVNSQRYFVEDERTVYDDGYTVDNATQIEALDLPGVTTSDAIYRHARFLIAQRKLRREVYSFFADWEHLVCTRGDPIRVNHDVPLWGLGSHRIAERVSGTVVRLQDKAAMIAGTNYAIRIRLADGTFVTRTVASVASDGDYDTLTVTASLTEAEAEAGNLVAFGPVSSESVRLIVTDIEPQENSSARIICHDYAPGVYTADTGTIPAFTSNITESPEFLQGAVTQVPVVIDVASDESVLDLRASGALLPRLRVSFSHPPGLNPAIDRVEGQIRPSAASGTAWPPGITESVNSAAITFDGVTEGEEYVARIRYVSQYNRTGDWVEIDPHTIVGKTSKPADVGTVSAAVSGGQVLLSWPVVAVLDLDGYEVRDADSGWGTAGALYKGPLTSALVAAAAAGTGRTWYVKAYDVVGNYSTTASSVSFTATAPGTVPDPSQDVIKVLTGFVQLRLVWAAAAAGSFPVAGYEIRSADSGWGSAGFLFRGNVTATTLSAISATVATTLHIRAYDVNGNYSAAARTFIHDVTPPGSMATATVTVTRLAANLNVRITAAPAKPADFSHYELRVWQVTALGTTGDNTPDATSAAATGNALWNDPDYRAVITASFIFPALSLNLFPTPRFSSAGITYKWAVRMVDKSGNDGTAQKEGTIIVKSLS